MDKPSQLIHQIWKLKILKKKRNLVKIKIMIISRTPFGSHCLAGVLITWLKNLEKYLVLQLINIVIFQ